MKRFLLLAILFSILVIPTTSMARTNFFFNIGLGLPLPVVVAPAPVVVAPAPMIVAPAPVIVAPPVYVQPYPTYYYGPPGWYHGKKRGWYRYHW